MSRLGSGAPLSYQASLSIHNFNQSVSPQLHHDIRCNVVLERPQKEAQLTKSLVAGLRGPVCGSERKPTALLLPCQSLVPLLHSRSSALIESHRT